MADTVLAAVLRGQNGTRLCGGYLDARIGHHPQPVFKARHFLADDPFFFQHQLQAAQIARRNVIVMHAAGNTPFQFAHQGQQLCLVERAIAKFVHRHQTSHHRASAGAQPGTDRHVLLQPHRYRYFTANRLAETLPALVNNVLFRIARQLADKTPAIFQAEAAGRFYTDAIPQQRAVDRGNRSSQHIEPDADVTN